jgi:hypothetical protein
MAMQEMNEFSVYWWDPDGNYYPEARFIGAEAAVKLAKSLTDRPAAQLGIIRRIIITDGGDCCCFEWKHGEGVTFGGHE